ncbi:MAG: hypothetical protein LBV23_06655 [Deltaproteobacteria bacterium]|jgi:hypothetical protein|nr:hypothetical protein [Deltaproteobacteria bacterium]
MLKLKYNSKVATSRNEGKKDLVNGYYLNRDRSDPFGLPPTQIPAGKINALGFSLDV